MPVIMRKPPPLDEPQVIAAPALLSAKDAQLYLACSHHEIRTMERMGIIKPVPYLHGRIKPRRYLKADLDKHIAQQAHIAQRQVEAA